MPNNSGTTQRLPPEAGSTARDSEESHPDPLEDEPERHGDVGSDNFGNATGPNLLPDLRTTQGYIDALRVANLGDSGMEQDDIDNLRRPGPIDNLDDPSPLLRSLRHFVNNDLASRDHYDTTRRIELLNNPDSAFLSYDQVKRRLRWLSGVIPIEYDMCPNTCIAYTGPHSSLESCPRSTCNTSRYIPGTRTARRRFSTIPIGPVIQAFYASPGTAEHMHYLERRLAKNRAHARNNSRRLDVYDDTACGQALLDAWSSGVFGKSDIALQLSIDGAQLRPDQPSETWVFIWIVHNLPPELRYTKAFVIPSAIVPGPKKPWDLNSFLFPCLYHIAALQREGLNVYDASLGTVVTRTIPSIIMATADSLGSAAMTGMVGHSGKYGCRLYCEMPGRHREGDGHYYPVMNRPDAYSVEGCTYPDVSVKDLEEYRSDLPRKYNENVEFLLDAKTQADFRARRLESGLCRQTLFSGLPCQPLPVPSNLTMDIMHLTTLNDPDLLVKLFTGKMDVYEPDDRSTWDWAVFYRNKRLWEGHGETVAQATPFIPSSFGRAPRDPAKKINSGYKAWEYQLYVYGLGPTLFRHVLPRKYWLNFCKLVSGIRLLQRHTITRSELIKGHARLLEFVQEYEALYYQRMEARIHFVRQSVHLLTHIGPETIRAGPLSCYAQWTLETTIGNLGREIRQDRDLYANLTQRAILRAQVNSVQARYPNVRIDIRGSSDESLPANYLVFEGSPGYMFLPRREEHPRTLKDDEAEALRSYWHEKGWPGLDNWNDSVCRWAKLQLPNGQKARSVWFEEGSAASLRRTSCVEVVCTVLYSVFGSLHPQHRLFTMETCTLLMCSFIFACASGSFGIRWLWSGSFLRQTRKSCKNRVILYISVTSSWVAKDCV